MLIDFEQIDNDLIVNYIDPKTTLKTEKIFKISQKEMFDYNVVSGNKKPREEIINWDGKRLEKIKKTNLSTKRLFDILLNIDPLQTAPIWKMVIPDMWFCDIETEILTTGIDVENTPAKVLSISICNKTHGLVLGLQQLSKEKIKNIENRINEHVSKFEMKYKFNYVFFEDERDMLKYFLQKIIPKISCLTGWNFIGFDWKYIINRSTLLGLHVEDILNEKEKIKREPFTRISIKHGEYLPKRFIVCDYMNIYEAFDKTEKTKRSLKLDDVSEKILGIKKIGYKGNLNNLYEEDFETFIFYNMVDSILVSLIHKYTNCIGAMFAISEVTKITIYNTSSKVPCAENLLQEEFNNRGKKFVKKYSDGEEDIKGITGGYVKEPIQDYYEFIAIFDFSSLYPSIIREFNISPEKWLGKNPTENPNDYIKTKSGECYLKNEQGVLPFVIENIYKKRKSFQAKSLEIENKIGILKNYLQ